MSENTAIEWADHTFNPWRGCTKISAGCANCYADAMSKRNPRTLGIWGQAGTRVVASESMWLKPIKWNTQAAKIGQRHKVFCASLADIFEGQDTMPAGAWELVAQARKRLWSLIEATPSLDWQILTKRPANIARMIPADWLKHPPANVWFGTSVENQSVAYRVHDLRQVPARTRFLSCEPLLGAVQLDLTGIHWVIVGGESGNSARPLKPEWVECVMNQCDQAGIPVFFKQWGATHNNPNSNDPTIESTKGGCQWRGMERKAYPDSPGQGQLSILAV